MNFGTSRSRQGVRGSAVTYALFGSGRRGLPAGLEFHCINRAPLSGIPTEATGAAVTLTYHGHYKAVMRGAEPGVHDHRSTTPLTLL